jgi:hypothetical protein
MQQHVCSIFNIHLDLLYTNDVQSRVEQNGHSHDRRINHAASGEAVAVSRLCVELGNGEYLANETEDGDVSSA